MKVLTLGLVVCSVLIVVCGQDTCSPMSCRLDNVAVQNPINAVPRREVFVGLVLPVHQYDSKTGAVCGTIMNLRSLLHLEAFFWALETYHARWNESAPDKLRGVVFDSCGSGDRFYEQISDFIACTPSINVAKPNVLAYLGYDEGDVTSRGAKLFKEKDTVFVSVSPHNPNWSPGNTRFYRLTPTLDQEVDAIVRILKQLQWDKVHLVYVDDAYGQSAYETFSSKARQSAIVIEMYQTISPRADDNVIQTTVRRLKANDPSFFWTVVVVFAYGRQKVKIQDVLGDSFVVVTSGNSDDYIRSSGSGGSKAIILRFTPTQQYNNSVTNFSNYISDLTWNRTSFNNPWFENYWMEKYDCQLSGKHNTRHNRSCDTNQKLYSLPVSPTPTALIIEAVDTVVGAFLASVRNCLRNPITCSEFPVLKEAFKTQFQEKVRGLIDPTTNELSQWNFDIFFTELKNGTESVYKEVGTIQKNSTGTIMSSIEPPDKIYTKRTGKPSVKISKAYGTRWGLGQAWVIVIGILACLGILLVIALAVITIVLYRKNTRISYLWLYAVLLFGALIGYLTLFAFIPVPTTATCGITRFGIGLSYGVCLAVMVVLALLMFKKLESSASSYALRIFIYVVLILLIAIEVVILVMWFILVPPMAVSRPDNRGKRVWGCRDHIPPLTMLTNFENHLLALIYIMVLILILLILAIMIFFSNRKKLMPAEQHEAKAILVAGVGCAVLWIAWALVGGLLKHHPFAHEFADAALAFGLWLIITLLLILLLIQLIYMWRASQGKHHKRLNEKIHKTSGIENHLMVGQSLHEETVTTHEVDRPIITIVDNEHAHEVEMHKREDWPEHTARSNGNVVVSSKQTKTEVLHTDQVDHAEHKDRQTNHREADRYAAHMTHAKLSGTSDHVSHHQHTMAYQPGGSSFCSECGYAINPNALHLVHPRSERSVYSPSSHNNSVFFSEMSGKVVNGDTSLVHSDTPTYTAQEPSTMYAKGSRSLYSSPTFYYTRRPESTVNNPRFVKVSRELTGRPPSRYGMSFSEFDRVRYPSTRSFRRAKSEEHLGAL